jgi:glycosyltransferase involved in cell wall biosynthesis
VLAGFTTQVPMGSDRGPEPVAPADGFDAVVAFCGKFADWKRLDALLRAAAIYEQQDRRILTLVIGSGPHEAQVQMHDLAAGLGLRRTYFVGPRPQDELATLFNCADVGCFPSYREPFGLVFIECMACGTPVIGADSGGPRDFVTPEVGCWCRRPTTASSWPPRWPARSTGRWTRTGSTPRARTRSGTRRRTSAWCTRSRSCSPRWTG